MRMEHAIRIWLYSSIFRISAVAVARWIRNERCARDSARVRSMIFEMVDRPCALSFRDLAFFFLFFFDLRSVNLEPRFKFQRALRPKEEDRRGLDKLSRRGAAPNGFSSFGSVLGPKDGKSLLLFCHCARFSIRSNCCVLSGRFACRPIIQNQSSWASRFFISVAMID